MSAWRFFDCVESNARIDFIVLHLKLDKSKMYDYYRNVQFIILQFNIKQNYN